MDRKMFFSFFAFLHFTCFAQDSAAHRSLVDRIYDNISFSVGSGSSKPHGLDKNLYSYPSDNACFNIGLFYEFPHNKRWLMHNHLFKK